MPERLLADAGIPLYPIDIQGVRGNGLLRLLKTPLMLLATTVAAMRLIRRLRIDAVAGFGGYVTAPGGLAARLCGPARPASRCGAGCDGYSCTARQKKAFR